MPPAARSACRNEIRSRSGGPALATAHQACIGRLDNQVAVCGDSGLRLPIFDFGTSSLDRQRDFLRVGTGRDNKVPLKLASIAVINQVNAGIDAGIAYTAVHGNANVGSGVPSGAPEHVYHRRKPEAARAFQVDSKIGVVSKPLRRKPPAPACLEAGGSDGSRQVP
jgi:hypothetical protein